MKPLEAKDQIGEVFPTAVEVVTWVDFGNSENLGKAARLLEVEFGRDPDDLPEPEPDRRYYALVWPCDAESFTSAPEPGWFIEQGDGSDISVLWTNAYLLGVLRGAWIIAVAGTAGIGGRVFAIRVQEKGAQFPGHVQHGDGGPVL